MDWPTKKYQIIYADPPWECSTQNIRGKKSYIKSTGSFHYNSMKLEDICSLPVNDIADKNALLFLWGRSPCLNWAFKVGKAWGFNQFSTVGFVWDKQNPLPSYYTLSQVELCLIFKKGKIPTPRGSRNQYQFLSEKKRKHSQKPDIIRERITKMFPSQSKMELFARKTADGWDSWGDGI